MEQNSVDWEKWRLSGLGSSDAPIVLGISPWMTRYELWELKLGKREPNPETYITQRGHRLEARARAMYEIKRGFLDFPPTIVEHERYPFLRASLDGYNAERRAVLEIKAPGKKTHIAAKAGAVPPHYYAQVQHQLMVTGAAYCDFVTLWVENEGKASEVCDLATVRVEPNREYCRSLFLELVAFWDLVEAGIPPEFTDRDFKSINRKEFNALCRQYLELRRQILEHETVQGLQRWRCQGIRASNGEIIS